MNAEMTEPAVLVQPLCCPCALLSRSFLLRKWSLARMRRVAFCASFTRSIARRILRRAILQGKGEDETEGSHTKREGLPRQQGRGKGFEGNECTGGRRDDAMHLRRMTSPWFFHHQRPNTCESASF